MTTAASLDSDDTALVALLESHHIQPLWKRFHSIASREPQPTDNAMHWSWAEMQSLIELSIQGVSMEHAERRALVMANPDFGGGLITTGTMTGALQIIQPGESADPHRHTAAAIRFVIESEGAITSVNGQGCEMRPGDLILTPAWTWHGHRNDTPHRAVWFDGLDVPLVRFNADAFFYEPGRNAAPPNATEHSSGEQAWAEAGMVGVDTGSIQAFSPKFHFSWDSARRTVSHLPAHSDGSRTMRYANPLTGGAVMPTMDCYLTRLEPGIETQPLRSTFSTVCVVAEGEGHSKIGDRQIKWKKNDVFSIPHWRWATHKATDQSAHIFQMTDRELYARLDLLRQERA